MPETFPEAALWLIPGAPLLAAILIALFGPKLLGEKSHWLTVGGIALAAFVALWLVFSGIPGVEVATEGADAPLEHGGRVIATGYQWMKVGDLDVRLDLRADAITAIMLTMVTVVSLLVAIFASGYMHGDPGYPRFFAEFSLFVFSMCMLVLAGNFLVVFIFWEAVGLCSYLLIGFWFRKPEAAAAAKKAFVVNRIGDFGFLLGIFLIWKTFGTLGFDQVFDPAAIARIDQLHPDRITLICLLLFVGAVGKSAQFPLHVWLPDAMEGPTPVSALIHAATMVTAGVYMVARATPLFIEAPQAQLVVAGIGGITALLAALIALTQNDLKRVLAYSTVSQLGFMFMALGSAAVGEKFATFAVTAALFHMFTHAFFKALLFLAAGSVMHSMGNVIDMRRFGGLRKVMPYTHWTFLIGAAALAGVPLLSGFWSKDEILVAISEGISHGGRNATFFTVLLIGAILTATLTAFYTFRAYFMTFWGEERFPPEAGHHPHESPPVMSIPLMLLAVGAVLVGIALGPTHLFGDYVHRVTELPHGPETHEIHWGMMAMSLLIAGSGIGLAWLFYAKSPGIPASLARNFRAAYELSLNKFYLDELYTALVVTPLRVFADFCVAFDRYVIDTLVDFFGWLPTQFGRVLRPIQNGYVQSYALIMLFGLAFFLLTMLRAFGGN